MKRILSLFAFMLVVTALSITPAFGKRAAASASPAASASATAPAPTGAKAGRAFPFHGMIAAVDARGKTFTINGKKDGSRIFKVSDQTAITKTGAAATMKDIAANEEVRGQYWKEADGSLLAKSIKLGPLTEEEKAAEEARKARHAERKAAKAAAASAAATASPTASASPKP